MKINFTEDAWSDYCYWQTANKMTLSRINKLIKEFMRSPFEGIGKPEPLKYTLSGYWSRRINDEHRIVYTAKGDTLIIIQCRYHY